MCQTRIYLFVSLFVQYQTSCTSLLQVATWNLSNYSGCLPKFFHSFSEHESSFRKVFLKRKFSSSAPVAESRKALHANLLKIALRHCYFPKSLTSSSEQWYWKAHLGGCFWEYYFLRTFLTSSFSKAAAKIHFKSPSGYTYFTFLIVTSC